MPASDHIVTFSRRKKVRRLRTLLSRGSTMQPVVTLPLLVIPQPVQPNENNNRNTAAPRGADTSQQSVLTPVQKSAVQREAATPAAPSNAISGLWRRKPAPTVKEKQDADQLRHVAELRAHYQEVCPFDCCMYIYAASQGWLHAMQVDSFELAVETPTPPSKPAPTAKRQPAGQHMPHKHRSSRAMSLGLSRRSSVPTACLSMLSATTAAPSPLRIKVASHAANDASPRVEADTGTALHSGNSLSGQTKEDVHSKQESQPTPPPSGRLHRLSSGIVDALQWLGQRGGRGAQSQSLTSSSRLSGAGDGHGMPVTANVEQGSGE